MGSNCLGCAKASAVEKDQPTGITKVEDSGPLSPEEEERIDQAFAASDVTRKRAKRKQAAVGRTPVLSHVQEAPNARKVQREKTPQDITLLREGLNSQFIYRSWTEEQCDFVINAMQLIELAAGEVVFEQGKPAMNFYVVETGEVEVVTDGARQYTVGKGKGFGGTALLHSAVRLATVRTLTAASLWTVAHSTFQDFIASANAQNYEENKQFINSIHMFRVLTPQQKEDLLQALQSISFPAGARIVTEGELGDVCYVVKEGVVVCSKEGKEIRRMGKGEFFGEQALLYGGTRTATITATSNVKCVSIGRSDLQSVLGLQLHQVIYRNSLRIALDRSEALSRLTQEQSERLIAAMRVSTFKEGQVVLARKTPRGSALWIVVKGSLKKANGQEVASTFSCIGDVELTRKTAGVHDSDLIVSSPTADIAIVSRSAFEQSIGGSLSTATQANEVLKVLKRVQLLRSLPNEKLQKLTQALRLREYADKEVIVKQSSPGDSFFIIESGKVDVVKNSTYLRSITKHDYFGERSVLFGDARTATITANGPVCCWVLEKSEFARVIDEGVRTQLMKRIALQDDTIALEDLTVVKSLGKGMFGTVFLVTYPKTHALYALKAVSRSKIDKFGVADNIILERKILLELDHPMILKLVKTYKDATHVYFLTEFVRGLDFFDVLRKMEGLVNVRDAKFFAGCLMLILEHLHEREIIYRDLKPENVMVDEDGYMKLIDFGTAKIVQGRTYTIVGTPHYMAPEMIVGKGYGMSVDYWSMGAILFECLCGRVPFGEEEEDPYVIYEKILTTSVSYPPWVKHDTIGQAKPLLDILLNKNPAMRTTSSMQALRLSPWFKSFNWDRLLCRQLKPPYIPVLGLLEDEIAGAIERAEGVTTAVQRDAREEGEPARIARSATSVHWDASF